MIDMENAYEKRELLWNVLEKRRVLLCFTFEKSKICMFNYVLKFSNFVNFVDILNHE